MQQLKTYYFLFFCLFSLVLLSCKTEPKNISAAAINYSITFPEIDKEKRPITSMLLPKKQHFIFKDNIFLTHIKKATFELKIRSETTIPTFYSEFHFNTVQHTHLENGNLDALYSSLPDYKVTLTDETDTLQGLNIKKALVSHEDIGVIDVWYTDDFAIKNPNWHTPYKEIPGVLVDYIIYQFGVQMNIKLADWEEKEISDSLLTIVPEGEEIPFKEFQYEIGDLFKNLLE